MSQAKRPLQPGKENFYFVSKDTDWEWFPYSFDVCVVPPGERKWEPYSSCCALLWEEWTRALLLGSPDSVCASVPFCRRQGEIGCIAGPNFALGLGIVKVLRRSFLFCLFASAIALFLVAHSFPPPRRPRPVWQRFSFCYVVRVSARCVVCTCFLRHYIVETVSLLRHDHALHSVIDLARSLFPYSTRSRLLRWWKQARRPIPEELSLSIKMDPSPPPSKTGGRRTHGFSKYGTVRSLRESLHPPFANYRSSGELRRIGYAVPHYVCVCKGVTKT